MPAGGSLGSVRHSVAVINSFAGLGSVFAPRIGEASLMDYGFLVPAHDPVALADALEALIVDRDLRQKMGAAGRARVEQHFSEERVVADTLAYYDQVCSR
jgi:glycosyltransferase involved in cell wall biosynthesis